ncbi:unnamed protein product [Lactuca saligna]|uniref:Legume lectin domain-containing protein n=1 Tax=Lactuca saligna TaxID=75948 RepID=A0AA35V1M7_LACSI|nr:unnamed protein product [Lactuca saligna]
MLFLLFFSNIATRTTSFDIQALTLTGLNFLVDAHLFNYCVRLTRDLPIIDSCAHRISYNKLVRFQRHRSLNLESFSTYFSLFIANLNMGSIGAGLDFIVSSYDEEINNVGAYSGYSYRCCYHEF